MIWMHSRRTGRLLAGSKLSSRWGGVGILQVGGAREITVGTHRQHVHHLPQDTNGLRLGTRHKDRVVITNRCSGAGPTGTGGGAL